MSEVLSLDGPWQRYGGTRASHLGVGHNALNGTIMGWEIRDIVVLLSLCYALVNVLYSSTMPA